MPLQMTKRQTSEGRRVYRIKGKAHKCALCKDQILVGTLVTKGVAGNSWAPVCGVCRPIEQAEIDLVVECSHNFVYGGIRYKNELAPRGGRQYAYWEWFYCAYCLVEKLNMLDCTSTEYSNPLFDATPMRREQP